MIVVGRLGLGCSGSRVVAGYWLTGFEPQDRAALMVSAALPNGAGKDVGASSIAS
jgi:hypothetical protein